jgi:hypothetical protein
MTLPMEKATYTVRARGCGFDQGKNHKEVVVPCEIVDHPTLAGERVYWRGYFSDATVDRTIESLQNMGWQGDDLSELEDLDAAGAERFLPDTFAIVCEPEEFEGVWRLKVKWVNKSGPMRKDPIKGNDLKAFAAQMKSKVRAVRAQGGAPRQTSTPRSGGGGSQPHPNAPGNRDDIPFASSALCDDPIAALVMG